MLLPRQGGFQASGFNKHHLQEVTKPGSLACRLRLTDGHSQGKLHIFLCIKTRTGLVIG